MSWLLRIDPKDAAPIWSQIEGGMRRLVASGALAPGTGAPSVRDLARELGVNPATVAKAYQRLTDAGVLEVRRGEGTYVSANPPALRRSDRARQIGDAALRFAALAITVGATQDEAAESLAAAWKQIQRGQKGGR
jgi:GntR family transcriptional regulator